MRAVLYAFFGGAAAQASSVVGSVQLQLDAPMDGTAAAAEEALRPALADALKVDEDRVLIQHAEEVEGGAKVYFAVDMDDAAAASAHMNREELAPGFSVSWAAAARSRGVAVQASVMSVMAETVEHADGQGCTVWADSSYCEKIASDEVSVEDIQTRKYGHAQFECMVPLIEAKAYAKLHEYAWCVLPHCPTASRCLMPSWGKDQCESEVHNILGFAYRSDSSAPEDLEEYKLKGYAHYHVSLALNHENCGTWGYLGQMYALNGDEAGARTCTDALCSLAYANKCLAKDVATLAEYTTAAGWDMQCGASVDVQQLFAGLPQPEIDVSENPFDVRARENGVSEVQSGAGALAMGLVALLAQ